MSTISPGAVAITARPREKTAATPNVRPRFAKPFFRAGGLHLILAAIGFLMSLPFVWMLCTSLKTLGEVSGDNWLPLHAQWHNYAEVFNEKGEGIPFARYYWNSIFVASWVTFLQVVTSSMAAFSFARLKWPGRDQVFLLYLSTMMLPALVMVIPNYQVMITLHLVDTFTGLILPAAFSAFGTFLLRQNMLSIPAALDEAAEIDGASKWRLFTDIILPLSRPGVITLTIFTFIGNYRSITSGQKMLR